MPTQEVARAARPSALLQCAERRNPVLLHGGGPDSWGRGATIYADTPAATLTVFASGWARWRSRDADVWRWGDPLQQWESFITAGRGERAHGGVLTVLSYDLKHWIEALHRRLPWPNLPLVYCARYDWTYRADQQRAQLAADNAAELARHLRWFEHAATLRPSATRGGDGARPSLCPKPTLSQRAYAEMIDRAHDYIAAGDVYEINLAQRFCADASLADAPALFDEWSARYPMPYAAYVDAGDWIVASNSPECLLECDGDRIATFPIKGTRRLDAGADLAAVAAALRADPKEQAEHVMVVDLERNDLGRICAIGSVEVADFAAVRQYPMLVHMVSEVRGRLRPGTSLAAILRAMFPGGSISGAPKVRALQLIEELEPAPRGFYTGAIGWTEPDGHTRFNIAIRTAVFDGTGLAYWAGGGIVADSDAEREYAETLVKSETFFRALRSPERRSA